MRPVLMLFSACIFLAVRTSPVTAAATGLPTIFVCGDSTAKSPGDIQGWGTPIADYFDAAKVTISNVAHAGTSSRTYYETDWPKVLPHIKPGDFLLLVFGINDGGLRTPPGLGDQVDPATGYHTYGWYMSTMANDAARKGARVFLLTVTPRNIWTNPRATFNDATIITQQQGYSTADDHIERGTGEGRYTQWTKDVGRALNLPVLDLTNLLADSHEKTGREKVMVNYKDHNHTYPAGADVVASAIVSGLKAFAKSPFTPLLSAKGRVIKAADRKYLIDPGPPASSAAQTGRTRYTFGTRPLRGYTLVRPDQNYADSPGFGYDGGSNLKASVSSTLSDKPFFFSSVAPEGNYRVTVKFGDIKSATDTTVNAELRRLMVEHVHTEPGRFETRSFIVNVRTPAIEGSPNRVRITSRESGQEIWAWDHRLTLEFNGARPGVATLQIEKVDVPTIYLIGDSTVCDQDREPYNSWGQMITRFIKPRVAIANHAESGESVAGALGKGRFDKIWAQMKPGDFLLLQFGHNDMKATQPGAIETFRNDLRKVIAATRAHGGTMILITPVSRRTFDEATRTKITNSFVANRTSDYAGDDYAGAVRLIAVEMKVPLIDLQSASATLYETLGDEASHSLFATSTEATHHGDYGSYEIAKSVVQLIRQGHPALSKFIVDDFKGFDPAHPDPVDSFRIPSSPRSTDMAPPGS